MNKKRIYTRLVAITLLLLLGFAMSRIGKQHIVYIDNKTITVEGEEFRAINEISIQIDDQDAFDSYKRERSQATVVARKHTITVSYTDSDWNEVVLEKDFEIPFSENSVIFSIPAFLAYPDDSAYYLTPFEVQTTD